MKVKIDKEKCIGCGTCVALAGEFFKIDEKTGKAKVIKQPVKKEEAVKTAILSCPAGAISEEKINNSS